MDVLRAEIAKKRKLLEEQKLVVRIIRKMNKSNKIIIILFVYFRMAKRSISNEENYLKKKEMNMSKNI